MHQIDWGGILILFPNFVNQKLIEQDSKGGMIISKL